ncbi:MAG: ATP-dependent zinc metalloprotease FtsH [Clostridia bacterium]|nr:ATP-dependent zinc metalloprotease FtsH [Clostridia bacterium]
MFVVVIAVATSFSGLGGGKDDSGISVKQVPLSTFMQQLNNGKISEINVDQSNCKLSGTISDKEQIYAYTTSLAQINDITNDYITPMMTEGKVKYQAKEPDKSSWIMDFLPTLIMILGMVFLFWFLMNQGGNGKAFKFGQSKAKMFKANGKSITFADVAGLKEEKQELEEVVDFLKNPRKYRDLGARIPKGILLVGPPGTGKTYISRATAGEAGVPFFTISGSDFVEMFVGVGASRVRDLFDQAKKNSPCIIFIDEIDAVGRKRGAGIGGGHDEREQTLNQLLVEMDGFGENTGIIILAATNRPDILDPALLRPGRFDRQVVIGLPDVKGREEIFAIHSKNKPLAESVSPEILAKRTPGFSPADIENLLNEAALITARRDGRFIRMDEIEEAITKVIAGPEKKSRVINEKERRLTAFHEAGHAVVAKSLPNCDPVHQITIIPRGSAGGFTMTLPVEDKSYMLKTDMENEIVDLLAGRAAEFLTLDDISTGASNDIQRATDIARAMVTKYGFSDVIGTVNYADSEEVFLGNDFSSKKNYSEETAKEIDEEVRKIVDQAYEEAKKILTENMDKLERVANALLAVETLDGDQFERLYAGEISAEELAKEVMAANEARRARDEQEAEEAEEIRKEEDERIRKELEKLQKEANEGENADEVDEDEATDDADETDEEKEEKVDSEE